VIPSQRASKVKFPIRLGKTRNNDTKVVNAYEFLVMEKFVMPRLLNHVNQGLLIVGIAITVVSLYQQNLTLMMQALILIAVVIKAFLP